jgi:hypothetical protein
VLDAALAADLLRWLALGLVCLGAAWALSALAALVRSKEAARAGAAAGAAEPAGAES